MLTHKAKLQTKPKAGDSNPNKGTTGSNRGTIGTRQEAEDSKNGEQTKKEDSNSIKGITQRNMTYHIWIIWITQVGVTSALKRDTQKIGADIMAP